MAFGEPAWASTGGDKAATTSIPSSAAPSAQPNSYQAPGRGCSGCVQRMLSVANISLSVLMAALGVLTIIEVGADVSDFARTFVSVYMIIFALLLAFYELMWWVPIPFINMNLRKNFGFMYGIKGKAAYLIFVAFLTIGLGSEQRFKWLQWTTGISFLAIGVFHIFLVCTRPDLVEDYKAPTSGYETPEGESNA